MRMSHVYQPAMLIECLNRGGSATVTDIARNLLGHDISQVEYYEYITKNMVGRVLTANNQITEKMTEGRQTIGYRIPDAGEMTKVEIEELVSLSLSVQDR